MARDNDAGTSFSWRACLSDKMPAALAREIDIYETELTLRKQGKLEEKLFAETRLRRGAYGQRYDNGQRHDGITTQQIAWPEVPTKGPSTQWDAPGMQRIKIPFGRITTEQLELIADLAEEYSDGILHVTTRQDIQLHFVHIDETPDIMRRLAAVGITTREACGNSVRNVTACPYSGVCDGETFDVTPYARAAAYYLLGHPDTQDFGRKFKLAFSGCRDDACALTAIHDIGAIAVKKDGKRGFELYVGGGLGAVPHAAKLLDEFTPEEELLPMCQAVGRVFARLGEKKNRQRARLKFVVAKLGIDEFRRLVHEERKLLAPDARWTSYLDGRPLELGDAEWSIRGGDGVALAAAGGDLAGLDAPRHAPSTLVGDHGAKFADWTRTNVRPQRQRGYSVATARLRLGDMTSRQARTLADLARRFTGETLRTTVEQNVVFRWVPDGDLPALHAALDAVGLGDAGAGTIVDLTACPGTDTCKLGISSSRGLAAELGQRLTKKLPVLDDGVKGLRIKMSGCFNACGQHHVADIGFLGVSRNVGGRRVPHFQLVIGGQWTNNAGAYGLAIGALPSKRIPEVVDRITERFVAERRPDERFQEFVKRIGKAKIRAMLEDLMEVPPHLVDPSFYSDWGDPREYTIGDMGEGECAGEVISPVQFGLAAAEREVFEAQLHLDASDARQAASLAYRAMMTAAKTLVRVENRDVNEDHEAIVGEFKTRIVESGRFAHDIVGDKFAHYFLRAHAAESTSGGDGEVSIEHAHQRVEEAQLFIEAAHACWDRMSSSPR